MESLGYKQKNKMVYQMIENMKQKSIDFDQFLDMMTARIVRRTRHT
jgi:Ca2+-binding EF-hand superfamily protein